MSSRSTSSTRAQQVKGSMAPVSERSGLSAALTFLGLAALFEGAVAVAQRAGLLQGLCTLTANAAGMLIDLSGLPVTVSRAELFLASRTLYISTECTGVFLVAALAALVLSSPATGSSKATGLFAGAFALLAGNLLRLVAVAHLSERAPRLFAPVHDYLFQVVLVLMVLSTWAVWMGWARRREA